MPRTRWTEAQMRELLREGEWSGSGLRPTVSPTAHSC